GAPARTRRRIDPLEYRVFPFSRERMRCDVFTHPAKLSPQISKTRLFRAFSFSSKLTYSTGDRLHGCPSQGVPEPTHKALWSVIHVLRPFDWLVKLILDFSRSKPSIRYGSSSMRLDRNSFGL